MKRCLCGFVFLSTLLPCELSGSADEPPPPNIVLIVADDLGYGELGCYGQRWIKTPNLDRLAAEGIRFRQHYCGQAVCAPSRCSLMTGMHQGHAWIRDNRNPPERERKTTADELYFPGQTPLPDQAVTLAELLKARGYATGAIGKWGLGYEGSSGDPNRQGFDLFYGYLCQVHAHNHYPRFLFRNGAKERLEGNDRGATGGTYAQDQFIKAALQFLGEHHQEPFFLYLPFAIPHLAIQVPEASLQGYAGVIAEADYQHRGYIPHPKPRAGYAAMVTHMDRGIGQILDWLAEHKIDDNTLVLFTSDNGPVYDRLGGTDSDFFQSTGPLRGRKGSLWEGGIRVPLVARWPAKIAPGQSSQHVSAFWDILPTLCEVAGAEVPRGLDGISLLPTLQGQPDQQRTHEFLYWEFPGYGGQQAVRLGDWKAIRQNLLKNPNASIQLYNLASDVGESTDVSADHAEVLKQIQAIASREHTPSTLFPLPALDNGD
jgi:arylsulfatase